MSQPSQSPKASPTEKRPKYGNRKVTVDGVTWDSQREYKRWLSLWQRQKLGLIRELRRQVTFRLIVNGMLVCRYVADFTYVESGKRVVEDAKGFRTPEYKLKSKLMQACYGITIREV